MGFTASFCLESPGVLTIWFSLSSISIFTERLLFLIRWSNQEPDLPSHFKQLKKIGGEREHMKWWFLDIRDSGERRSMQSELPLGRDSGSWHQEEGCRWSPMTALPSAQRVGAPTEQELEIAGRAPWRGERHAA